MITIYTVSSPNRVHHRTLSLSDAQTIATVVWKREDIIAEIFESLVTTIDHTRKAI